MTQLEQIVAQLQNGSQQLQLLDVQRQTLALQKKEMEKALEALEAAEDEVYKSVGPVLVRTNKDVMKKELLEAGEEADIKLKAVESQEKKLRERVKELQEKLQSAAAQEGTGG